MSFVELSETGHSIDIVPLIQRKNLKIEFTPGYEDLINNGSYYGREYHYAFAKADVFGVIPTEYARDATPNFYEAQPIDILNINSDCKSYKESFICPSGTNYTGFYNNMSGDYCFNSQNIQFCGLGYTGTYSNNILSCSKEQDKIVEIDNPEKKTAIVAIEVLLYPNDNRIAKIIGIYYCDLLRIYDLSRYQALVDINADIDYEQYGFIQNIFIDTMEKDESSNCGILGENIPIIQSRRRLLRAPIGYAVNGFSYLVNNILQRTDINVTNPLTKSTQHTTLKCNSATTQLVLRFSKVYDKNAPYLYSGIVDGAFYNQVQNKPSLSKTNNLQSICEYYPTRTNEFIQSLSFAYLPYLDPDNPNIWAILTQYSLFGLSLSPGSHWMKMYVPDIVNDLKNITLSNAPQTLGLATARYLSSMLFPWGDPKLILNLFKSGDFVGFFSDFFNNNVFKSMFDDFLDRIKILDDTWYQPNTFGFKGIIDAQSIVIKDKGNDNMYTWISQINNLKTCDFDPDNWYDQDSVEFLYNKYIRNYYVNTISPFVYIPSQNCLNEILQPYCNIVETDKTSYDRFRENRCEKFCSIDGVNCDISLKTFCKFPPKPKIIVVGGNTITTVPPLEEEVGVNYNDLYVTKHLHYDYKYYKINEVDSKEEYIVVPNIKNFMLEEICGCLIEDNPEYMTKMKNFYNNILNIYKNVLNTVSEETDIKNINKEIENLNIVISELDLYDIIKSFKKSVELNVEEKSISEIIKNGNIRKECSLPACRLSKYKLNNMKRTDCNLTESCLGNGFAIPMTTDEDTKIECNLENRIDKDVCVQPLEPKIAIVSDINNYMYCKNVVKSIPDYKEVLVPNDCVITENFRSVGCVGDKMKYVKDILIPEYPPGYSQCPPEGEILEKLENKAICRLQTNKTNKPASETYKKNIILFLISFLLIFLIFLFIFLYYKKR